MREARKQNDAHETVRQTTQSIDWYAPGQSRTVEIDGVQVTVRFVGRNGRRARIAIVAPAGAVLRDADLSASVTATIHSA